MIQQALLTRLIEDAYDSSEDGIAAFRRSTVPPSDDERTVLR